jgi:hypothetical protein
VKDIYFCLSQQSNTGTSSTGKVCAARHADDATFLKAIWLDVDGNKASEPDKGYASLPEAQAAVTKFVADAGLPEPSAIVMSGGGLHVYWISDKPLTPDEWRPYANGLWALVQKHGLKADSVTTDAARVLRIPGTFNRKTTPPKPVQLLTLLENEYDFEKVLGHIRVTETLRKPKKEPLIAESMGVGPHLPDLLTAEYQREIGEIEKPPLLPIIPIVGDGGCPFFYDALKTNGRDHVQGLWMQIALATTFMQNGRTVFHALSRGHAGYDVAEADAMYERKEADREARDLGWPDRKSVV